MTREDIDKISRKFEEKYGPENLLKVAFSTINKMIIQKGICTEAEMFELFINEICESVKELVKK